MYLFILALVVVEASVVLGFVLQLSFWFCTLNADMYSEMKG